ncbi:MAG: hypothetical protein ACRDLL_01370 [Solirubrobacterales bacterium]
MRQEIQGVDGEIYELVDEDDEGHYNDELGYDPDDFTLEEKVEAMEGAIRDMQARGQAEPECDAASYEDNGDMVIDGDSFNQALLVDLEGIANHLGRTLTNREVDSALAYAESTGNAPSQALDQLGIKELDMTNSDDRVEHAAEILQEGMDAGANPLDLAAGDVDPAIFGGGDDE